MVPVYPSEAKRESLRRWILIDAAGNCTVIEGFKHMIMQRFQINARDLRVLDPIISSPSSILIRAKAIVLNLEHVKVIISAKEVLIGDPNHPDVIPVVKEFRRHLERRGQADRKENSSAEDDADTDTADKDETPFEFRALEVALEAICSSLGARATQLEMSAYPALDELTTTISSLNLERVRQLKNWITKLNVRVQKVRDVLEQLLGDDDDMADFYLSRKSSLVSDSGESIDCDFTEDRSNKNSGPKKKKGATVTRAKSLLVNPLPTVRGNDKNDVEEVEMLLEAYFMKIDSTWNKLTAVREYIDDTEDYINIQLDSKRNQLIKFEIILSAGSICVSVYSLVVGILGMNIPYSWNTKEYMFKWVVSVTTTLCAVLFVIILWYARYKRLIGI